MHLNILVIKRRESKTVIEIEYISSYTPVRSSPLPWATTLTKVFSDISPQKWSTNLDASSLVNITFDLWTALG